MQLSLYNTLSQKSEPIFPEDQSQLRFYCCGPTVYGPAHIGNFRTFVVQDAFRRLVEFLGIQSCHVRNITDVDDKTIRASMAADMSLEQFTKKWQARFEADCKALNLLAPQYAPSAVGHIAEQIELIQTLITKGHAYVGANGSVYYRIASFADYGKLSRLNVAGARKNASQRLNDQDEYDKESWQDFVLWKAWKPEDGPNRWESPWGDGRPGWHIECSAMSMRYLGESFDLHSGGIDLVFPHHENEIAQSEAATGKPFARHWLHVAHLRINGEKMSKSLGNLYLLEDVKARGFSMAALRYLLLSGHYRQPLNFTWESLAGVESTLQRIVRFTEGDAQAAGPESGLAALQTELFLPVVQALCEDLNTAKAFGALNSALHQFKGLRPSEQSAARADLIQILRLLGLPDQYEAGERIAVPAAIQALAERRQAARLAKDWSQADAVRDSLRTQGWEVSDTADGFELSPVVVDA